MARFLRIVLAAVGAAAPACFVGSPCAAQSGSGAVADYVYPGGAGTKAQGNALVYWKGSYYPAQILRTDGPRRFLVHYVGYDASWDEWVGIGRVGTVHCQVEYQGRWYAARVRCTDGKGNYLVHYVGYESSWDEWVGRERLSVTMLLELRR